MATPPALREQRASIPRPTPTSTATVEVTTETLGGVPCVVCQPAEPVATLVHFHGGGFRLGSAAGSAAFGTRMADVARLRVVLVDYALAPEHPFPAGLHDAIHVYDAIRAESTARPTLVGGDSAGGGLATSLVVAALAAGLPLPRGVALFSPWLDLTVSAGSYDGRAQSDMLFSATSAKEAANLYLQGWDPHDPLASPVLADLHGFPPTILFVGSEEVLLDDALTLADSLSRSGSTVALHSVAGMQHVWPTIWPELPESATALRLLAAFVADLQTGDRLAFRRRLGCST